MPLLLNPNEFYKFGLEFSLGHFSSFPFTLLPLCRVLG